MAFEDMHRPLSGNGFKGAIKWIIIISGVMLVLQQFVGSPVAGLFGLVPANVTERFWLWQPFTYLFLHGGIFHWLFNMLILWMFGRELEVRWGTVEFLKYFFITGVGAALCVICLAPHSHAVTVGSSGAVFGMLVAFAVLFPEATMYLYFVVPMKAWQAAALFAVIEIFAAYSGGGNAPWAHLGGMVAGYLYLKFAWQASLPFKRLGRTLSSWWSGRGLSGPTTRKVELHEVTDDLVNQVDGILDKILKQGPDSLTSAEKKLMEKYSRLKR